MPTYFSPTGNPEIWDEKPDGYFSPEEWAELHPQPEPDPVSLNPGNEYVKRGDGWWKVRFSKKDFLLLCGVPQVAALNAAINAGNVMAKTVHDLLFAAEYIDVTDPATMQMVHLLTAAEAGAVLTAEQAAVILQGVPYVAED